MIDSGNVRMDQFSFAPLDYAAKKKRTKRDVFLAELEAVVPWVTLKALSNRIIRRLVRMAGDDRFR